MKLCKRKSGQTMLEYILVFAALLGIYFAVQCFSRAARKSAERTTTLVTCDYP